MCRTDATNAYVARAKPPPPLSQASNARSSSFATPTPHSRYKLIPDMLDRHSLDLQHQIRSHSTQLPGKLAGILFTAKYLPLLQMSAKPLLAFPNNFASHNQVPLFPIQNGRPIQPRSAL